MIYAHEVYPSGITLYKLVTVLSLAMRVKVDSYSSGYVNIIVGGFFR